MPKEIKKIPLLILLLFLGGTLGYYLIEDWTMLDALYMTVITLSTTGYKEIYPLSEPGRVLTMILIILGITVLFYALKEINLLLFEGKIFRERKMQKKINQLDSHYIIYGFGRMGKKIAQELHTRQKSFVIIEMELDGTEHIDGY
jgi:voltage-gated potassium channel